MELSFKFFANFREAVGEKEISREYTDGATAGEVLADLESAFAELDLLEGGDLRPQINVLRNGRGIIHMEGVETVLEDGDTLSIFPPVAGGADEEPADGANSTTITESFRGISQRLAVKYLENLGGEHVDGPTDGSGTARVEASDWDAALTAEKVDVAGGSLQLTEVTVRFEGDSETLPALVERFSQKAMRAGG